MNNYNDEVIEEYSSWAWDYILPQVVPLVSLSRKEFEEMYPIERGGVDCEIDDLRKWQKDNKKCISRDI